MEQNIYDLLTNLVKLAFALVTLIAAMKSRKGKRARHLPRNHAGNVKEARKDTIR